MEVVSDPKTKPPTHNDLRFNLDNKYEITFRSIKVHMHASREYCIYVAV